MADLRANGALKPESLLEKSDSIGSQHSSSSNSGSQHHMSTTVSSPNRDDAQCGVISDVNKNYLTPIDVVVKNEENNLACIRARFALTIKVEEAFHLPGAGTDEKLVTTNGTQQKGSKNEVRAILGYLPLENVLHVEDTCPDEINIGTTKTNNQAKNATAPNNNTATAAKSLSNETSTTMTSKEAPNPINSDKQSPDRSDQQQQNKNGTKTTSLTLDDNDPAAGKQDDNELEMIVTFECGKLSFVFQRDENRYFMSSIKGIVKLGEYLLFTNHKLVSDYVKTCH